MFGSLKGELGEFRFQGNPAVEPFVRDWPQNRPFSLF